MRLDPKKVRFVPVFIPLGLRGETLRFVGKENTVDLQETALVVEGNLLKAGLLGLELLFRRALAEWSAVTIPYSRITAVRYVRFPLLRLLALVLLALVAAGTVAGIVAGADWAVWGVLDFGVVLLLVYLVIRVPPRYVIRFRTRDGRRTKLMLRVRTKKLRAAFNRRLHENREAAARFADRAGAAGGPDPLAARRSRTPIWLWVFAVLFVLAAGTLVTLVVSGAIDVLSGRGDGLGPPTQQTADGPVGKAAPVAEITPEAVRAGLVGQTFAFQPGPGKDSKLWRVEPGEVRELQIVGTEPVGDSVRRVHVRVTLQDKKQQIRGVLTVLYMKQADGWVLLVATPKDGAGGKAQPFEVTDVK